MIYIIRLVTVYHFGFLDFYINMQITGTHINYYHLCHRKLWLFANGIQMEHTSGLVEEGKLIHEKSYPQRASKWKEIEIDSVKIDHYDPKNKIIREIKKSNKKEESHSAQLQYYIYILKKNEIEISHGILEYPKLRETNEVWLTEQDRTDIEQWKTAIKQIVNQDDAPQIIHKTMCKKCAYYDFCFVID